MHTKTSDFHMHREDLSMPFLLVSILQKVAVPSYCKIKQIHL